MMKYITTIADFLNSGGMGYLKKIKPTDKEVIERLVEQKIISEKTANDQALSSCISIIMKQEVDRFIEWLNKHDCDANWVLVIIKQPILRDKFLKLISNDTFQQNIQQSLELANKYLNFNRTIKNRINQDVSNLCERYNEKMDDHSTDAVVIFTTLGLSAGGAVAVPLFIVAVANFLLLIFSPIVIVIVEVFLLFLGMCISMALGSILGGIIAFSIVFSIDNLILYLKNQALRAKINSLENTLAKIERQLTTTNLIIENLNVDFPKANDTIEGDDVIKKWKENTPIQELSMSPFLSITSFNPNPDNTEEKERNQEKGNSDDIHCLAPESLGVGTLSRV